MCFCVSVCHHSSSNIARFYAQNEVYHRLFSALTHGFSIKPSIQKLWCAKTIIEMNTYLSQPVLVRFE